MAAGHDPDHLLETYSLDQLALYARCILGHHVRMLEMIIGPVLQAQGVGYKPTTIETPPVPGDEEARDDAREERLLRGLAASPFKVRTRTSVPTTE